MNSHLDHLTDDELIDRLYGICRNPHECADCERRLRLLEVRRSAITAPPETPASFLAAQRRSIYARMGERPRTPGWLPTTVGVLCLAAASLIVYRASAPIPRPVSHAAAHVDQVSDAQLFSDVYMMESSEPHAAAAINELLEEN